MHKPTIIAMGGGGFGMEPENPLLDEYVLSLTGKERPSVCFVPTASGDAEGYIERFLAAFDDRADTAVLRLFRRTEADLAAFVARQDVVYVGGGNTANMLAVWRLHGLDAVLRDAWRRGTILCGLSAGALCWFEGGVTDSFGVELAPLRDGLGLLPGSFCPHYDGEPLRRPTYERLVQGGDLAGGWAADDGVALHFEGTELVSVVASRANAAAWRVGLGEGGQLVVERLQPSFLGELIPKEEGD